MKSQATWQLILPYTLVYLLWLANCGVCVVAVLEFRSAANVVWVMSGHSLTMLGPVNQAGLFLGGPAVLAYVVFLEGYYRRYAAQLWVLMRRFAWTTAIPVGVLFGSALLRHIAAGFTH